MYYKLLSGTTRLEAFRQAFEQASGNKVSMDYLANARVIGLYRKGQMIGGFVLNRGPELRYAGMLEEHVEKLPCGLEEVTEITCYFLTEKSPFLCSLAGLVIAFECWRSGSPFILAGTRIEKVYRTHSRVLPNVFHQGLVDVAGSRQYWWFYWADRTQLPKTVAREIAFRYFPRRKRVVPA